VVLEFVANVSFYPSLLLLASRTAVDLGEAYQRVIDAVINCEQVSEEPQVALWRQYLADELPDFTRMLSDTQLRRTCRLLAQVEPRESRMAKTLLTAKRLALSRNSIINLKQVLMVIRSSIPPKELENFDGAVKEAEIELYEAE
jgi:hypothetical protein